MFEKIKLDFLPYKEFAILYHKNRIKVRNDNLELVTENRQPQNRYLKQNKTLKNFSTKVNNINIEFNRNANNVLITKNKTTMMLEYEEICAISEIVDWETSFPKPISKNKYEEMIQMINGEIEISNDDRFSLITKLFTYTTTNLKEMNYYDFLKTTYWEIIRRTMIQKSDGKCQVCYKNNSKLNVHHLTYFNRGSEIWSIMIGMPTLTVLCDSCHCKFHNKEI